MTKQFNLGCFHESSPTQSYLDTKTSKSFKSKNFNNHNNNTSALSSNDSHKNSIIQKSKNVLARKKLDSNIYNNNNNKNKTNLKKKRLYASSDNLNWLGRGGAGSTGENRLTVPGSLSNSNSAKSLSLTTNNFIFNNQLTRHFASFNTQSNTSNSSLPSASFHSLISSKLNEMVGSNSKKVNDGKDLLNFSLKAENSNTSIETKEPVQVYSALLNNQKNDDAVKSSLEKHSESNINNSLSTGSNDIGQAELTSNEINSLFSCSDKEHEAVVKLKNLNIDSDPRLSDLMHSSSVTCSTSSLATSYTSNLFDTSLIITSNILKTSSSESLFGRNKPFDCYLSNSSLSSSSSSVTNISNCSHLTLTESKKVYSENRNTFLNQIESSFYYDKRNSSIPNLVKGCSKNSKKIVPLEKQENNWKVKEKTIVRPPSQTRPSSTQLISPRLNEQMNSYNQILENIKNINKKIIENNQEIMSIENFTNTAYFSTSSSSASSSFGSFQASPTSTESTSSFSSISEFSTHNTELNKAINTSSLVRKETRSVALCYYHHLFNEKQKISKHLSIKKNTQPLYKLTYNDMNVKCEKSFHELTKRKPIQDFNFEIYKSKNETWMDLSDNKQNTNKIFRQETTRKLQLQAPANFKRHSIYYLNLRT
jgi:trimeric autotransporter adhesin